MERKRRISITLESHRETIAILDKQLIDIIATRMTVTHIIGRLKDNLGVPIINGNIEKKRLREIRKIATARGLDPKLAQAIMMLIFGASYRVQLLEARRQNKRRRS